MNPICKKCDLNERCLFEMREPCEKVIGWENLKDSDRNTKYKSVRVVLGPNQETIRKRKRLEKAKQNDHRI